MKKPRANRFICDLHGPVTLKEAAQVVLIVFVSWFVVVLTWALFAPAN